MRRERKLQTKTGQPKAAYMILPWPDSSASPSPSPTMCLSGKHSRVFLVISRICGTASGHLHVQNSARFGRPTALESEPVATLISGRRPEIFGGKLSCQRLWAHVIPTCRTLRTTCLLKFQPQRIQTVTIDSNATEPFQA